MENYSRKTLRIPTYCFNSADHIYFRSDTRGDTFLLWNVYKFRFLFPRFVRIFPRLFLRRNFSRISMRTSGRILAGETWKRIKVILGGGGYRNRYGWKKKKKKGIIGRREDIASSECRSRLAHQNKTWILHVAGPVSPRISYIYTCVYLHTYKCTIVDRRTVERGYSSEHDRGKKASRKNAAKTRGNLLTFRSVSQLIDSCKKKKKKFWRFSFTYSKHEYANVDFRQWCAFWPRWIMIERRGRDSGVFE